MFYYSVYYTYMLCCVMINNQTTTYNHKRVGTVVLLESTAVLAKVLTPENGDEFWVKLSDLTQVVGSVIKKTKPGDKSGKSHPNSSSNSRYRVVRAA